MRLIQNGKLHTMADQGTIIADILIDNGKIAAIGEQLEVPSECEVMDASGLDIYPGFIDYAAAARY